MTKLTSKQMIPRCQHCGYPVRQHPGSCHPPSRAAFDQSQNHLAEIDRATGELLAAIMKRKSIESIQNSHYANEFFGLMDLRRTT